MAKTIEEKLARIAALNAEASRLEQEVAEDPLRNTTYALVVAAIEANPFLVSLGATAAISEIHPEWCNVDFPLEEAGGERALAIKYIMSIALANGAEQGKETIEEEVLDETGDVVEVKQYRKAKPGRLYFPLNRMAEGIEVVRRAALTEAERIVEDTQTVEEHGEEEPVE